MGHSIILSEIKAEVPLQNENSSNHQILWQQYIERIKSHSQESKVSRFCLEAGFMRVVEVGHCVVQGLQEVTLLWNSVGFRRVGASGASTSG